MTESPAVVESPVRRLTGGLVAWIGSGSSQGRTGGLLIRTPGVTRICPRLRGTEKRTPAPARNPVFITSLRVIEFPIASSPHRHRCKGSGRLPPILHDRSERFGPHSTECRSAEPIPRPVADG